MRRSFLLLLGFGAISTLFLVEAGPPLICHPYRIGDAKSLPWGTAAGWDARDPSYDLHQAARDTLAILNPSTPVLIRMETMRRAAIYGVQDHAVARELLAKLRDRELEAKSNALAEFDYGYFLASLKQMGWMYKEDLTGGLDGYEYVQKALKIDPDSAAMHFAAAIVATDPPRPAERDAHIAKAREAKHDTLLAENLTTHRW